MRRADRRRRGSPRRAAAPAPPAVVADASTRPPSARDRAPHRSRARTAATENPADALFCEECGYDFTTGQLPAPPPRRRCPTAGADWVAELWIDPDWFAHQDSARRVRHQRRADRRAAAGDDRHRGVKGQLPQSDRGRRRSRKTLSNPSVGQGRPARDRRGVPEEKLGADGRAAAAVPARADRPDHAGGHPGARQGHDRGPVQRHRSGRHAEPPPDLHLQAGRRRAGRWPARKTILSTLGRRAYRRPVTDAEARRLIGFYQRERTAGGTFDAGIEIALAFVLASPQFLFRVERDPDVAPGQTASIASAISSWRRGCRSSSGAAFPTTSCSTLAVAGPAEGSGGARAAGAADAGRSARRARSVSNFAGQWLYLRNLQSAAARTQDVFPDFDDNLRQAFQRETELFFESIVREDRSVLDLLTRGLHVRQRAAGPPLRHSRRLRQPVPPRRGHRRRRARAARPGQHPDGDLVRRTAPRRCCAASGSREPPRHAAAAAARRTCRRSRTTKPGEAAVDARADGAAPREPGVRRLPQADGSDRLRARELRRDRRVARRATAAARSTRRARCADGTRSTASSRCGRRCCSRPELFVAHDDREAADLRARPRPRVPRHAGVRAIVRDAARAATTGSRRSCSAS